MKEQVSFNFRVTSARLTLDGLEVETKLRDIESPVSRTLVPYPVFVYAAIDFALGGPLIRYMCDLLKEDERLASVKKFPYKLPEPF